MESSDIIIIGGGIIGLATAYEISRRWPRRKLLLLEKERWVAQHQTGRNSGVLHSGIYYRPGSQKAVNCRVGLGRMIEFCRREGVPYEVCGKVIVATEERELTILARLQEQGQANEIRCELIGPERLREIEPHCAGIQAVYVPETGIVDFGEVCRHLAAVITEAGHRIVTGAEVRAFDERSDEVVVNATIGDYRGKQVVNCAGLYCDRISALGGNRPPLRIFPFRGEYFEFAEDSPRLCRNLIYPVPDPRFPFLGVHLTRMIGGGIHCGPNAVMALAREGYRKTDIDLREIAGMLGYPGFYRMAARHWKMGFEEMWRSMVRKAFVRTLQRLVPEVRDEYLVPAPAGVRAQGVSRDGDLVDDFAIVKRERMVHVLNAPSPAATASLCIGQTIVEHLS